MTEFSTNVTHLIKHFCHIEKHLTAKHWFWPRRLQGYMLKKIFQNFISKQLPSVEHKRRVCRMLPNHFGYPWFLWTQISCIYKIMFHRRKKIIQGWNDRFVKYVNFHFWVNLPLRMLLFVNKHLIYPYWINILLHLKCIRTKSRVWLTSTPIRWWSQEVKPWSLLPCYGF